MAKGNAERRNENNRIYAHPLPLIFEQKQSLLGLLGFPDVRLLNPDCEGVYDPVTKSVWVINAPDSMILWRRGFFGKGTLSRSEPSWLARQQASSTTKTSEAATAKRRAERKQFKFDRAKAMAEAAAMAEVAFAEGRTLTDEEKIAIPSSSTWKPTFHESGSVGSPSATEIIEEEEEEAPPTDMEHLQLTLHEAFFLLWSLDCLHLLDPRKNRTMSLRDIWQAFQAAYLPLGDGLTLSPEHRRSDNPFLIHYALYHHYRSLGWIVRGGIKFCVDYLLYKRGPVFHHAEFALVLIPVYEDPSDRDSSPFELHNVDPFSWSWLSTLNRINSQVQKTLVLVYVTIPSMSRLSPDDLDSPASLGRYSVREVIIRRFVPARMRD